VPLVLSYSPSSFGTAARPQPRLMAMQDLQKSAADFFKSVNVIPAGRIAHSKFNAARLNGVIDYSAEAFIVAKP
jgi:hypothetical protein